MQKRNLFFSKYKSLSAAFAMLILADAVLWQAILFPKGSDGIAEFYFLDVGQGDSQLIQLPSSGAKSVDILIDGGQPNSRALSELADILALNDSYIDLVVMTHPQADHFGGLIDVVKKYDVGLFIANGRKAESAAYDELIKTIAERRIQYLALGAGDRIRFRDSEFRFLHPDSGSLWSGDLNDTSFVILFERGPFRALYTGDIGFAVEKKLLKTHGLSAQILKVPHHGSKFSSSKEFLEDVSPALAVIGVGKNSYGHPTEAAISRIEETGARVLRTDLDGTVRVTFDGETARVFRKK